MKKLLIVLTMAMLMFSTTAVFASGPGDCYPCDPSCVPTCDGPYGPSGPINGSGPGGPFGPGDCQD